MQARASMALVKMQPGRVAYMNLIFAADSVMMAQQDFLVAILLAGAVEAVVALRVRIRGRRCVLLALLNPALMHHLFALVLGQEAEVEPGSQPGVAAQVVVLARSRLAEEVEVVDLMMVALEMLIWVAEVALKGSPVLLR